MGSKRYFEEVSGYWDSMRENFFPDSVRDKAIAVANVKPGKTAADIGAGTGFVTEGLISKKLNVIAVDQSEAMLRIMKDKYVNANIDYRIGGAESLPLSDKKVDYVFANMYLHHVDSPSLAIDEMVRILKPGGKLIITDMDEHDYEFLKTEQHDRWMGFKRDDVVNWFSEAGLKKIVVDCVNENCCAKSNTTDENADVSIFVASGTK